VVEIALMRSAPFLPRLSMITFATALPSSPPTGKVEVTTEKVASDIGMHCGRPWFVVPFITPLQVRTAFIWFNAEMW
jgi:hypothetical protein